MLGLNLKPRSNQTIACCLGESSYSIAAVANNTEFLFGQRRDFTDTPELMAKQLAEDVTELKLIGAKCRVVLTPGQYQLLLMDALDIPAEDMAKALRWRLKGLIDYPLNDLSLDIFFVPPHGAVGQRKKVFVAVTRKSALQSKLKLLESAFLEVCSITIAELSLRNLMSFIPNRDDAPLIVICLEEGHCQLQVLFKNMLFLVRELPLDHHLIDKNSSEAQMILLEIQRSIDYCLTELKLPEPRQIVFTPSFYEAQSLIKFLREELAKELMLFDLAEYMDMQARLSFKEQQDYFYSIGGALTPYAGGQDD